MSRMNLSLFLSLLWKLSTVYIIPIVIHLYIISINETFDNFNFQQLDQGQNVHKWIVLAFYLLYLLFWLRNNKRVINYLKKLEY